MVKVAVIVCESTSTTLLTVAPTLKFTETGAVKLVPFKVTLTAAPGAPVEGVMEESVGATGPAALTV